MATVTKPIALDESLNTTEQTPRNVADVLAQELARIAGRPASDVNYDNTDSGLTAENVQDAIDELKSDIPTVNDGTLTIQQNGETKGTFTANQSGNSTVNIEIPTTDIQTAVDEFETYNGGLLSECIVELIPVQSGSGDPSPDNVRPISGHTEVKVGDDGKNRLSLILADIKSINTSGTWNGNVYTINGGTFEVLTDNANNVIGINVNGTFNANTTITLVRSVNSLADGTYILNGCPSGGSNTTYMLQIIKSPSPSLADFGSGVTFTKNSGIALYQCYLVVFSGVTTSNLKFYPMIRLASDIDPTFAPYNGYQITVNLGGTYYSGTLDVVSGVFVPDMALVKGNGLTWIKHGTNINNIYYTNGLQSVIKRPSDNYTIGDIVCSDYVTKAWEDVFSANQVGIVVSNTGLVGVANPNITTLEDFQTAIADTDICYGLATPLTIQLTPQQVQALVGENNLSAPLDGQEIVESKYKQIFTFDDVNAQIESTYSEGISHNSVYRGKYLGDHVTDEQWDAIGDGSFRDLYIGDYWTINGINWRIAHFNYWLGTGDVKCSTNHVVIVPSGWVSTFKMNASDDTTGGYLNSEWYTTNRHFAVENIEAAFGASHILSHRNFLSDAVSDGHASHCMWVDSTVDLMNEIMVCGSLIGSYLGSYYEVGCDRFQLALFKYNPPIVRMDFSYWLRGISTGSHFVAMGSFGLLDGFTASQILKIRPTFAIKK